MEIIRITKKGLRKAFRTGFFERLKENGLKFKLDSENLTIEFYSDNPFIELKGKDVLNAFCLSEGSINIDSALKLFSEDMYLKIINLDDIFEGNEKNIKRILSRIIGINGKTKLILEEITESSITIYNNKIFIIGFLDEIHLAYEGIDMLIDGAPHRKVYAFLEKGRYKIREQKMKLWKGE